jgi:hypothetical protein
MGRRRVVRTGWIGVFAICFLFVSRGARASKSGDSTDVRVGAELALEYFDADTFARSEIWTNVRVPYSVFGCTADSAGDCPETTFLDLRVPVRWRLIDGYPQNTSIFRRQDYADAGDFLRIIRSIRSGDRDGAYQLSAGQIGPVTFGYGTIVRGYLNELSPGAEQTGLYVRHLIGPLEAQVLVDDLAYPSVGGVRLSGDPVQMATGSESPLEVGLNTATDLNAPVSMRSTFYDSQRSATPVEDDQYVSQSEVTTLVGLDIGVRLWSRGDQFIDLYSVLNKHLEFGEGGHLGADGVMSLGDGAEVRITGEFRIGSTGYIPSYFGADYEITRATFAAWNSRQSFTQLQVLANQTTGFTGGMGRVELSLEKILDVSLQYANHTGTRNDTLVARVGAKPSKNIQLGVLYSHRQLGDLLSFEQPSYLAGEVQWNLDGPLYLTGGYRNLWRYADRRQFQRAHEGFVGFGFGWSVSSRESTQ